MNRPINAVNPIDVLCFSETAAIHAKEGSNTINEYQKLATRSAIYPGQGTPFGLMYAALGLAEAGEVQNKVKKAFRDDGIIDVVQEQHGVDAYYSVTFYELTEQRKLQLVKELGGVLWYVAACCNEIGVSMSDVAVTNLKELASRSERGTLGGDGDNR